MKLAEQLMLSWVPLLTVVGVLVFLIKRHRRGKKREENMLRQLEKIETRLAEISEKIDRK